MATTLLKIDGESGFDFTPYIAEYSVNPNSPVEIKSNVLSTGYVKQTIGSQKLTTIEVTFAAGISSANIASILAALDVGEGAVFDFWSPQHGHARKAKFSVEKDYVPLVTSAGDVLVYNEFSVTLTQRDIASDLTSTTVSRFAGTITDKSGTWTDEANIQADDGNYCTNAGVLNYEQLLYASNFGFDSGEDALPATAIINSVTIEMQYKVSTAASNIWVGIVAAYKRTNRGTVKSSTAEPLTDEIMSTNLTGKWTAAELRTIDAMMKVGYRRLSSTACTLSVDYVKMTVDYTAVG